MIGASATIKIMAQSQAWISVHAKLEGFVVIKSGSKLFDKHKLICMNEVAHVEPDKMFQLIIATFANKSRQILKG